MRQLPDDHGRQARAIDLVAPLGERSVSEASGRLLDQAPTDTHTTGTAVTGRPGAVSPLSNRRGDEHSATQRAILTTPGTRTSTMATRTSTTRTTPVEAGPSADQCDFHADFSFLELVDAYFDCVEGKRNTTSALDFEEHLVPNLYDLYTELNERTYRPGRSICFVITHPKVREVWAAEFRDRIVHHLLYNRISPRFHKGFIADSSACIPGRGTLYAAERLEAKIRSITENWKLPAHYLHFDLANCFVSINKRVLWEVLSPRIHEPFFLWLAHVILFHDPRENVIVHSPAALMAKVPAHKRLMNQAAHMGLPIGNLDSQFFLNVLLNLLDKFIKHEVRCKHYGRYVDDGYLLHRDPQWLVSALARIKAFLPSLDVKLNDKKTVLQPVHRGVDFVGHVIKPGRREIRRRTFHSAMQRVAKLPDDRVHVVGTSYLALLNQASHSHTDRAALARLIHKRGFAVDQQFTKVYKS